VRSVVLGVGCASFVVSAILVLYSVIIRPDLLRSERHQEAMRLIELAGEKDMPFADFQRLLSLTEPARRPPWHRPHDGEGDE